MAEEESVDSAAEDATEENVDPSGGGADEAPSDGVATTGVLTQEQEDALDDEVLGELDETQQDESRGGQRAVSVLFASIAGFETDSSMSQDEIEEAAIRKGAFDEALREKVETYGGVIDKIIRGFFMATFGTTTASKDDPILAVLAAMEMTQIAADFEADVHCGVNTGQAWVGQIRTERTIDTTVIGDTINLSARLKTQAGHNQVVCSPEAYEATKDYFEYEELRTLSPGTLKGIERPMIIYTPIKKGPKADLVTAVRGDDAQRLAELEERIPEYLKEKIKSGSSRLQGERKMVTLLYSDVSGFTALSEKFATQPELIAEVMNRCHKRLGDIVYKHEGVVDKLVGDEIMAIFGAPIIHEDDPERAIWCALEMQEEMARLSVEVEEELKVPPLSVHIGVNTGRVSIGNLIPGSARMDYTVIGEPTELAEELEDCSKGGEVVVGQRTYRLTRALFNFEERPPIEVGGKEIPIYLVLEERDDDELKRGIAELGDVPMIGREEQWEQAMRCVDRIFEGQNPITCTVGEAGFGKSRLKREVRNAVEERGGIWVEGSCFPNTVNQGYSIFLRAFEDYFGLKDTDSPEERRSKLETKFEEVFDGDQATIEEILPYVGTMLSVEFEGALAEKVAFLDPEQLQRRTFVAIRDLLGRESGRQPVVVALDDLHWVDNVSNDLIYFLMENIEDVPVWLMNIYRPERRDLCWQIGETAEEKYPDRFETISIEPLTLESAQQLLDIMLPMSESDGEQIKPRLLEKAGGNPFYIEEFIRVLLDDDFIEREGDLWLLKKDVSEFEVPDSLEQMLSARIDKLDDGSKATLQSAAVVGRRFEHLILSDAVEDTSDLDDCLSHLTDLDFIREESQDPIEFLFGHIVTYEISYSAIVSGRRRSIHGRVGGSYEGHHAGDLVRFLELLAYHFSESTEKPKAIHYNGAAGSKARRMFNNQDAVTFYERGLEFIGQVDEPDAEDRLEILEGLGDVYSVMGQYENAIGSINSALEHAEEGLRRATYERKLGNIYTRWGQWDNADGHIERALELLGSEDGAEEAALEKARALDTRGFCCYSRGEYADGNENCSEALALVQDSQALDVLASVYKNLGNINLRLGKSDDGRDYYSEGIEIARRIGDKLLEAQLNNNLAVLHRMLAQTDDAVENARRAIELGEQMADADGLAARYPLLGSLLRQQGDNAGALESYQKALAIAERTGSPHRIAYAEILTGGLFTWMKEFDHAIEHYERGLEFSRTAGYREGEMNALVNLTDLFLNLGEERLGEAENYATEATDVAGDIGLVQGVIAARKNMGVVYWRQKRYDEALEEFRAVLGAAQEAKVTNAEAEIYRNIGDVYLELDDPENAREPLTKAAELFDSLGSTEHAEEIRERTPSA